MLKGKNMKILLALITMVYILNGDDTHKRIKVTEIEGRLKPISVYEVCLSGIIYFVLVDGYKAAMSPAFKKDKSDKTVLQTCEEKEHGRWK
jgi:hypothetical protein